MRIINNIMKVFTVFILLVGITQFTFAQTNLIQDGGFETGYPNSYWNETSTNFGTPLCDAGFCGGPFLRTGSYWAWFGGISSYEVGSLDQNVVIPFGTAQLRFWLYNPVTASSSDFIQVEIDDNPIFIVYGGNPTYSSAYTEVVLNLNSYANGASHKIEFYSITNGLGTTNFHLDDVSLMHTPTPGPAVPLTMWSVVLAFLLISTFVTIKLVSSKRIKQ
jgi:hypothetical protein